MIIQVLKTIGCILFTLPFAALGMWLFSIMINWADDVEAFLKEQGLLIRIIAFPIELIFFYLLLPCVPIVLCVLGWILGEYIFHL